MSRLAAAWQRCVRLARALVGVPDYGAYVAHLRACHPQRAIPNYAEFFNERQRARYRHGGSRCC